VQGTLNYHNWRHSDLSKEFIQQCCTVNPAHRQSAAAALQHPWILSAKSSDYSEFTSLLPNTTCIPNELVVSFDLFRMSPPLKRIALNTLASRINTTTTSSSSTTSKSSKYRQLFCDLDTTLSGTLTKAEFLAGFNNSGTGHSPEELDDLFVKLDINGNGAILYTEFLAATLEEKGELQEEQLQEAFDLMDTSRNGYITKKDLIQLLGTSHNVKEMVKEHSSGRGDKDKGVTFEEFAQLFEHGFSSGRGIDTIVEMSLNEEQLKMLQSDEMEEHMSTIRENS
jgi:calcium-dependent protein kinase